MSEYYADNDSQNSTESPIYWTTENDTEVLAGDGKSEAELYCHIVVDVFEEIISGDDEENKARLIVSENGTESYVLLEERCVSPINNHDIINAILLSSACVLTVLLMFLAIRKNILKNLFHGRPGFLHPMPVVEPSQNRLTYAAFWGMVTHDALNAILSREDSLIFKTSCKSVWVKPLILLLNIHVYAVIYFPIIGGFSTATTLGYVISTGWTWALAASRLYIMYDDYKDDWGIVGMAIPAVLFILFLCIILPVRLVKGLYLNYTTSKSLYGKVEADPPYMDHPETRYVQQLFRPKLIATPVGALGKIKSIFNKRKHFRYSHTIVATMVIAGTFLFELLYADVYLLTLIRPIIAEIKETVEEIIIEVTAQKSVVGALTEAEVRENARDKSQRAIDISAAYIYGLFDSHVFALVVVAIIQIILIVTLPIAYRRDMLRAFRGKYKVLLPPSYSSSRSVVGGAVRYIGLQSVMFAWGLLIQLILFTIIAFVVNGVIIIPLRFDFGQWILDRVLSVLPAVLVTICLIVIQMLLAAFAFSAQPCGNMLAVNNPRGLSTYAFLSFFKNIFVGILTALLRLILATVLGAIVFSRLDMPTITPIFRNFDSGFKTYESLIHLESAHLNPTMVTFVNMVLDAIHRKKYERAVVRKQNMENKAEGEFEIIDGDALSAPPDHDDTDVENEMRSRRRKNCAIFRWYLARTLHSNPMLIHSRKETMDARRAKIEQNIINRERRKKGPVATSDVTLDENISDVSKI